MKTAATRYRLLARHKRWLSGATISEFCNDANSRRFTATIRGWGNWYLWEGDTVPVPVDRIIAAARQIRDRIDAGDEAVFHLGDKRPLTDILSPA